MSSADDRPAPLLPPDFKLPDGLDSFMLNGRRVVSSQFTVTSTGDEFKASMLVQCAAWLQQPPASLPNDDRALAGFARVTPSRWKKLKPAALHGFVLCSDNRLYNEILVADAKRASAAIEKKRAAARHRWATDVKARKSKGVDSSKSYCSGGDPDDKPVEASTGDASHVHRTCDAHASPMPDTTRSVVSLSELTPNIVELPSLLLRARGLNHGSLLGDRPAGTPGQRGFRWGRRETAETRLMLALIDQGLTPDAALTLIETASNPNAAGFDDAARACSATSALRRCGWYAPKRRVD